jgi:hypothetical protein
MKPAESSLTYILESQLAAGQELRLSGPLGASRFVQTKAVAIVETIEPLRMLRDCIIVKVKPSVKVITIEPTVA